MEEKKEKWYIEFIFYIPRLLKDFFSAFSMSDEGWSLKKLLAVFSTLEAAKVTNTLIEANNVIIFTLIWLVYAGILVGIYSLADISKAVGEIKQNLPTKEEPKEIVKEENKTII